MSTPQSTEERVYATRVCAILREYAGHNDDWTNGDNSVLDLAREADAEIARLRAALRPFATAALAGEKRYAILQAAGVGVMDLCDGFNDVAKRHLSVANYREALAALDKTL